MKDITVDQLKVGEIGLYGGIKLQAVSGTGLTCSDCYFVNREACVFAKCDSGKILFEEAE